MAIDRIDWHWDSITDDISEDEHWERAGVHIGYYIEWAYKKGFAPNDDENCDIETYQKVANSEITGIEFLIEYCDTKFWETDLNEEGRKFTKYAYDKYYENLESILGHKLYTEKYNSKDFENVCKFLDKLYSDYITNPPKETIEAYKVDSNNMINNSKASKLLLIILCIIVIFLFMMGLKVSTDKTSDKSGIDSIKKVPVVDTSNIIKIYR